MVIGNGQIELVPAALVPSAEALDALTEDNYSDLFPNEWDFQPDEVYGDYRCGDPPKNSVIDMVSEGIRLYRAGVYQTEAGNDGQRTEETRRSLMASVLQIELAKSIGQAHQNLVDEGFGHKDAADTIAQRVDEIDSFMTGFYDDSLDDMAVELAALERGEKVAERDEIDGLPILDFGEMLGGAPASPELRRQVRQDFLADCMYVTRLRIQRLRFEWLSARALIEILKSSYQETPQPAITPSPF